MTGEDSQIVKSDYTAAIGPFDVTMWMVMPAALLPPHIDAEATLCDHSNHSSTIAVYVHFVRRQTRGVGGAAGSYCRSTAMVKLSASSSKTPVAMST